MTRVIELFGNSTEDTSLDWKGIVDSQHCPYTQSVCIKVRKSQPEISIGTCSVLYGRDERPIVICPFRLLQRNQIFLDCLHLLRSHEPGNELHIVPEVSVPGGSVDYFLVSALNGHTIDFVGVELQTLDTTGTVWPARQEFLREVKVIREVPPEWKTYGMNWKMTAKTILVQLHHKIETFEQWKKTLVLVIQDHLLHYLRREFQFSHVATADTTHSLQMHSYTLERQADSTHKLRLADRLGTDAAGIATSLGLQADSNVHMQEIVSQIDSKLSEATRIEL